jgi:hypothetical protein
MCLLSVSQSVCLSHLTLFFSSQAEDEIKEARKEIENLEDQLFSLQIMRQEDQREEKWAHRCAVYANALCVFV